MDFESVAFFDTRKFEKSYYQDNPFFKMDFFENKLTAQTANLVKGYRAVCCFVNDRLDKECLEKISSYGVEIVVLRCAGFNNVDIDSARSLGLRVCRVPSYSPESVAEFTLLQMLALSRKIHRSYIRTRDLNFSLEGLVGSTLSSKTVGVIGTGQIGESLVGLLSGFGCKILAYDKSPSEHLKQIENLEYVSFANLLKESDLISLHVPLTSDTYHMIGEEQLKTMKKDVFLINTSRGGLVDAKALIGSLKKGALAGAAIDVYEEEEAYFFENFSDSGIDDDILARLVSFPNVLLTSHQGFLTDVSLFEIAKVTFESLSLWLKGEKFPKEVCF